MGTWCTDPRLARSDCESRYFWFKYDSGQKDYTPRDRPDRGSNSWPPDHDSTFHVTDTPALTTRPSVTLKRNVLPHYLRDLRWFQMHGLSDIILMNWQLIFLVQVRLRTEVLTEPWIHHNNILYVLMSYHSTMVSAQWMVSLRVDIYGQCNIRCPYRLAYMHTTMRDMIVYYMPWMSVIRIYTIYSEP